MPMRHRRIPSVEEKSDILTRLRLSREKYGEVASCLRELAPEIRRLRKQSMTWQTIGDLLTEAGIVYQTGRPWSGQSLQKKLSVVLKVTQKEPREALSTVKERSPLAASPSPQTTSSIPTKPIFLPARPRPPLDLKPEVLTPEEIALREAALAKLR